MRLFLALLIALPLSAMEIAVTFDDLPSTMNLPLAEQQALTKKLVGELKKRQIPVTAFVVSSKVRPSGHPDPRRIALLEAWLDAGFDLGNHTYSHPDLHRISVEDYKKNIADGERDVRPLLEKRGKTLRWFRHPFLRTGRSIETRDEVHRFLAERGVRVAPVTLDNSEWIFARAYEKAKDEAVRKRIRDEYIRYMSSKNDYYDQNARKLFGRSIRQVLLVHANQLNADAFGALADAWVKQGHTFISLDRAMEDPAYRSEDTWTGQGGISWLDRWAIAMKVPKEFFAAEPRTAKWVLELAEMESE